jgi:HK97 family phage major capsid protein
LFGNSARLVAESTAVDDNAGGGTTGDGGPNPTFAQFVLNDWKYTSDTILVPYELLQDSPLDLVSILGSALGERLARKLETDFTVGAGTTLPFGIVTRSSAGVTSGSTTSFAADDMITLQHSVNPSYRGGAAWMMHDSVIAFIRKLKDAQGQYLWQSGFAAGVPDTILGAPVYVNQAMSSAFTTGQKLVIWGKLSQYKVRRIGSLRFYRLQERYRQKDQDGFVAFIRCDGDLLDAGTDPVKHLALA